MLPKIVNTIGPKPVIRLHARIQTAILLIVLLVTLSAGLVFAGEFKEDFQFDAKELALSNLIGEIEISGTSGSDFIVEIQVQGDDAEKGLLEFDVDEGRKTVLSVKYPTDKHRKYVYPPMGRNSNTSFSFNNESDAGGSWLKQVFSGAFGDRIKVAGRGSGLEIWADIIVKVPEGGTFTMKNGVGTVSAQNVDGDLTLDTCSGAVEASDITGNLLIDTGSGRVTVDEVRGDLLVDTGSGRVTVNGVKGDLNIDTGSGGVSARGIECDQALIDTGSGSVLLEIDRMGSGDYVIDTGSGGVELVLPNDASARIIADTGSGGIRNRVDDSRVRRKDDDYLDMIVGDGEADVRLDTGSGSVSISQQ